MRQIGIRSVLAMFFAAALAACSGGCSGSSENTTPNTTTTGGGGSTTSNPGVGGAPSIDSFTVSPGSIASGQAATLSWTVSGQTSMSINNGVGPISGASGSISVSPTSSTTYTLTAINAAGQTSASIQLVVGPPVTAGGPALLFTDLVTVPNTGNSDTSLGQTANQNGAYVTVWGMNLGSSQGSSQITLGGQTVPVVSWANATAPANLYAKLGMQMIVFQVPSTVPTGAANLQVTVNGVASNLLPLTVTNSGPIYFVAVGGSDSNPGTFASPWATVQQAASVMQTPGSITYVENGVTWSNPACLTQGALNQSTGQLVSPGAPLAFVAYPGATATTSTMGFDPEGCGANDPVGNWVFSKFTMNITGTSAVFFSIAGESRFIGNYVTAPNISECPDGALLVTGPTVGGNNIYELGNEFGYIYGSTSANPAMCKLSSVIYVSGGRFQSAPITSSNREVGWNYVHDLFGGRGIEVYQELDGTYAESMTDVNVHDNWLENVRGEAITFYSGTSPNLLVGNNFIVNNVLVNAGVGPSSYSSGQDATETVGILANDGATNSSGVTTNNYFFNNTFYYTSSSSSNCAMDLTNAAGTTLYPQNNIFDLNSNQAYYCETTYTSSNYGNVYYGNGSGPSWDTGAINANPNFVNASAENFQLSSGSPAIGVGVSIPSAVPFLQANYDIASYPIPSSGVSMGAYQFENP